MKKIIFILLFFVSNLSFSSELINVEGSFALVQDDILAVIYDSNSEESYEVGSKLDDVEISECNAGSYIIADRLEDSTFELIDFECQE